MQIVSVTVNLFATKNFVKYQFPIYHIKITLQVGKQKKMQV